MVVVIHQGALGDWVLLFPLLRGLSVQGKRVVAVTDGPKARLAAKVLTSIEAWDLRQPFFSRLRLENGVAEINKNYVEDKNIKEQLAGATNIVSFLSNGQDAWAKNICQLFAGATHLFPQCQPPVGFDQPLGVWHGWQLQQAGLPVLHTDLPPRTKGNGPIVIHPGSGGVAIDKNWPASRYESLIRKLRAQGRAVEVILGNQELERWPKARLQHWIDELGAQPLETLEQLYEVLLRADVFVGNDSGPTHLAAQLGIATVALFGPTSAVVWGPRGPRVKVLAPRKQTAMSWLLVDTVSAHLEQLLGD